MPCLRVTHTPRNSPSLRAHADQFSRAVRREFEAGRYIGPFSRAALESHIGPFQSSPLSIIPKATKPGAFRLVQNFSFPPTPIGSHTSINSHIDSNKFPCTWATFVAFGLLVSRLPPGSQACTRDVSEAYRNIPLHPSQWPGAVVRLSDGDAYAIDTQESFGCASYAGRFGYVQDAAMDILRGAGIGPEGKWVDDLALVRVLRVHLPDYNAHRAEWRDNIARNGGMHHSGGRVWFGGSLLENGILEEFDEDMSFPIQDLSQNSARSAEDARFSYCLSDVDALTSDLGIPWQTEKDTPWSTSFIFTGLLWNLDDKTVTLPHTKIDKYLRAIREWHSSGRTKTLEEVQKLYGKLLHASLVIPQGRAYLTNLEKALGIFHDNPWKPRTPPKGSIDDLRWWEDTLSSPLTPFPVPSDYPVRDIGAFSDASTSVGIAIVVGTRWRAWKLREGWQEGGRDIGWAEAVGFELLVRAVITLGEHATPFFVRGDNKGVVEGWRNGRSRSTPVNEVFKRVHSLLPHAALKIHARYVEGERNPADGPSRGIRPTGRLLPPIALPDDLADLLDVSDDLPTTRDNADNRPARAFQYEQQRLAAAHDASVHTHEHLTRHVQGASY